MRSPRSSGSYSGCCPHQTSSWVRPRILTPSPTHHATPPAAQPMRLRPPRRPHAPTLHPSRSSSWHRAAGPRSLLIATRCPPSCAPRPARADVDDLEDIGDLEGYVERTEVVLFFLSKGYFLSRNCVREIDASLAQARAASAARARRLRPPRTFCTRGMPDCHERGMREAHAKLMSGDH
eukprot:2221495-Prymnesium_polylepis.2